MAMTFGEDTRVGAALVIFLAVAHAAADRARRRGRLVGARAGAAARASSGLAGAFPALAGTARSAWTRGAIAACGAWWLLLAEPLLGHNLLLGLGGLPARPRFDGAASIAASEVVRPIVTSGAPLLLLLWAAAAVVMPWLVRGRSLAADIVGATVWSAGLAAATASLGVAVTGAHAARAGCRERSPRASSPWAGDGCTARPRNLTSHTPRHA